MKIYFDSKDIINIFEKSAPCSSDILEKILTSGAIRGKDADHRVQPGNTREQSIYISGIRILLGQGPERKSAFEETDIAEEITEVISQLYHVVQDKPEHEGEGNIQADKQQTERLLQLLRSRQLEEHMQISSSSDGDTAQVAEPEESEEELQLEWV